MSNPSSPAPSGSAAPAPAKGAAGAESSASAPAPAHTEIADFAGGCFWCMEAVFEQVPGVVDVKSGFMGGTTASPTYRDVCEGDTGHAECIQVTFDPAKVSYATLLDWFWKAHDPTTLDRQGADAGTQYRSAIFWTSEAQRDAAEKSKKAAQARFDDPIVTEIARAGPFTEADEHHQDFYRLNASYPYCRAVIQPKLRKLGLKE